MKKEALSCTRGSVLTSVLLGNCYKSDGMALTRFTLASIIFPSLVLAADFTGRVVGISDGDTISVMHGTRAEKIRLGGIDCPEKRQAFGQQAKQFTSKLAFGKDVTIKTLSHDKYGRTIGDVILPDGRILNQELVKAGARLVVREIFKRYGPAGPSGRSATGKARSILILFHHGSGGIGSPR